jgi:leucyl-tRNA synthetase
MSKSRGNVVSPRAIVERYGADTARCYVLFIGPADQDAAWSDEGMEGVHRFLARLWRLGEEVAAPAAKDGSSGVALGDAGALRGDDRELARRAQETIARVTEDLQRFAFNRAIAAVMELVNDCYRLREAVAAATLRFAAATAGSLIFPFAPYLGAEVFQRVAGRRVWEEPWPVADPALLARESFQLVCQVNGKVRDRVFAPTGASEEELRQLARAAPNVRAHVDGHEVVREVVVPGKLVNVVVR